jgi:hypothetical protein
MQEKSGRNGTIIAAVITAVGAVLAAVVTIVMTQFVADGSDGERHEALPTEPTPPPDPAPPTGTSPQTETSPRTETSGPAPGFPALHQFVYGDGSGVTVCGKDFPKGETLHFQWVHTDDDGNEETIRFDNTLSKQVNGFGAFYRADDNLGPGLPDGTVRVQVEIPDQDEPVYTDELGYHNGRIDKPQSNEAQCPW